MYLADWNIEELTGYKPKTTFYTDLSIADHYGLRSIRETFNDIFKVWTDDSVFWTEFVMALNWKIWEHYGRDNEKSMLYQELYEYAIDWTYSNYTGEDLHYFIRTTD